MIPNDYDSKWLWFQMINPNDYDSKWLDSKFMIQMSMIPNDYDSKWLWLNYFLCNTNG